MKRYRVYPGFMEALFPLVMTIIAFMLFLVVYLFLTTGSINERYIENLLFAVPFFCFTIITIFTASGKIKGGLAAILTSVLMFALGAAMLVLFSYIVIKESTAVTTDVSKYERVLKLSGYPADPLTEYLPMKIPENAENVFFSYTPAFMQGGEYLLLRYNTDADSIEKYITLFSRYAQWEGKLNSIDAEKTGISTLSFRAFGYDELPEDFTVYLLYGKPYRPFDWNHGEATLTAVSRQRGEIIFHAEDW